MEGYWIENKNPFLTKNLSPKLHIERTPFKQERRQKT
jgi:hypothetical protein